MHLSQFPTLELGYGIVCDNWQDWSLVETVVLRLNAVRMEVGVSERCGNGATMPVRESRERPDEESTQYTKREAQSLLYFLVATRSDRLLALLALRKCLRPGLWISGWKRPGWSHTSVLHLCTMP